MLGRSHGKPSAWALDKGSGPGTARRARRDASGRGDRRAVEGAEVHHAAVAVVMRVAIEIEEGHEVRAADHRAAGHPTSHDLRDAGQVRRHAVLLLRATGGEAEAGDDLVEDEQDAALRGDLGFIYFD